MRARWLTAFFGGLALLAIASTVPAQPPNLTTADSELADDFRYLANNTQLDFEDILTSPRHVADSDSPFRAPRFYLVLGAAGALWGGSFALDQTMRANLRHMSPPPTM